jgi:hypothetical protein
MAIIIVNGGVADALRTLLPVLEPLAMAVAGACGAGFLVQLGLDVCLRLAQRALRPA